MKRIFSLILMLGIAVSTFGQDSILDKTVEKSEEYLKLTQEHGEGFVEMITPYIKDLAEGVKSGVDFVATEAPIVVRQYLWFETVRLILPVLLGILLITYLRIYFINFYLKKSKEKPEDKPKHHFIKKGKNRWLLTAYDGLCNNELGFYFFNISCYAIGILLIAMYLIDFIKVAFFPKLYLVEKFLMLVM